MKYRATLCGLVFGPKGLLKLFNRGNGCLAFSQYKVAGKVTSTNVHTFVWEFFNGPVPEWLEVDHKDGDKTNNRLLNLQLLSHGDNLRKAKAKLTPEQVKRIRSGQERVTDLAREFGVHQSTISKVKNGSRYPTNWKGLTYVR